MPGRASAERPGVESSVLLPMQIEAWRIEFGRHQKVKSCPTCNRTYSDDSLSFCLVDGAALSDVYDPYATSPASGGRVAPGQGWEPRADSEATVQIQQSSVTVPAQRFNYFPPAPQQTGNRNSAAIWIVVGAAVLLFFLGIVAVVAIGLVGYISTNKNREVATQRNSQNKNSTNSTPAPTPKATPESTPTIEPQLELSGTWAGEFDNADSTLSISQSADNSFTGTISSKTFEVAIAGQVEPESRKIDFKETKVLRYDGNWRLGTNSGTVTADGRKMSGKGKSVATYTWSFNKE